VFGEKTYWQEAEEMHQESDTKTDVLQDCEPSSLSRKEESHGMQAGQIREDGQKRRPGPKGLQSS
jgi:hypothetical protein